MPVFYRMHVLLRWWIEFRNRHPAMLWRRRNYYAGHKSAYGLTIRKRPRWQKPKGVISPHQWLTRHLSACLHVKSKLLKSFTRRCVISIVRNLLGRTPFISEFLPSGFPSNWKRIRSFATTIQLRKQRKFPQNQFWCF